MPFLTIAGTDYRTTSFRWDEPIRRGEDARAFNGALLLGTDVPKRSGSGDLFPLPAADVATLRSAVEAGAVAVAGDAAQGVAGSFRVRITGEEAGPALVSTGASSYREDWAATHWTLSLSMEEV